ncbi:MAG: hypothetical protein NZ992_00705 [Candidatus Korarchaeum sp.]|nr:hypothetical protein [Candidatus Korarchaeum sp.]MDW8035516.1 hypothetical protein [Candidatus Korarchaeum sp.]
MVRLYPGKTAQTGAFEPLVIEGTVSGVNVNFNYNEKRPGELMNVFLEVTCTSTLSYLIELVVISGGSNVFGNRFAMSMTSGQTYFVQWGGEMEMTSVSANRMIKPLRGWNILSEGDIIRITEANSNTNFRPTGGRAVIKVYY